MNPDKPSILRRVVLFVVAMLISVFPGSFGGKLSWVFGVQEVHARDGDGDGDVSRVDSARDSRFISDGTVRDFRH